MQDKYPVHQKDGEKQRKPDIGWAMKVEAMPGRKDLDFMASGNPSR